METVVGLWQGVGICRKGLAPPLAPPLASPPAPHRIIAERRTSVVVSASKSLNWVSLLFYLTWNEISLSEWNSDMIWYGVVQLQKSCKSCGGKGAVECPGCKVRLCFELYWIVDTWIWYLIGKGRALERTKRTEICLNDGSKLGS